MRKKYDIHVKWNARNSNYAATKNSNIKHPAEIKIQGCQ